MPNRRPFIRSAMVGAILSTILATTTSPTFAAPNTERGKYLIVTSHCNNCHTAGYAAAEGDVPESRWLTGNPVGWKGRAGTVYAPNLRLMFRELSEEQWLALARQGRARPPMPWWSLRDTNDEDLRAIYGYVRSLSPLGAAAPDFLPADRSPPPPYNQLPDVSIGR